MDEKKINELLEKRAKLIHDAREICNKAEKEERDATAEERQQFDKLMDESDKIQERVKDDERLAAAETTLAEPQTRVATIEEPGTGKPAEARTIQLAKNVCGEERSIEIPASDAVYREGFRQFLLSGEHRALSKGTDSEGGYLSAPLEFMAELIVARDNMVFMRQISRVLPPLMESATLGAPTIDTDISDPDWTTELLIGSEDSSLAFGRRDLAPNPLAKWIKVSKTLLRRSTMNVDTIVRDRLAKKFARAEENGYLNGDGSGEPLGIFTASGSGISVGRDVQTDNTVSAVTMDGLINCQSHVASQYRQMASWIFHRTILRMVRKLKDDDGQYHWQPSTQAGQPDVLLGSPVRESEYAPNTIAADAYVGIYGDFSEYWIVDALTMTIQVLIELYAATNQTAYLGRLEADGAPVDELAFARVQLASS